MYRLRAWLLAGACLVLATVSQSHAVRIMPSIPTEPGDPPIQIANIALTPDGATIIATGRFNQLLEGDRVYSLALPANPATQTATVTQLSSTNLLIPTHNVAFAPVISPDGQTILHIHDGNSEPSNAIYTMSIGGRGNASTFSGLFGSDPNLVSPGIGNINPIYSPNGSTIFFINEESAFNGSIPDLSGAPGEDVPVGWEDAPDWDQIFSVPAGGGAATAITQPGDGDVDSELFAVTPNGQSIVYAPDNPIRTKLNRGDIRPKLFSVSTSGGASSEIPITSPGHIFSIEERLAITPNGQNVLFIADYATIGKNELFSIPIAGGTPTRINDDLPFAGDVSTFAIAPDGGSVAYAAGQNTSSVSELFLKSLGSGAGASIRVSDPPVVNSGVHDVAGLGSLGGLITREGGQVVFSADSSQLYYVGDLDADDVKDLYVVDTTEKTGLTPSSYTYVGPPAGQFFDEANWEDAQGNNPPAMSLEPNGRIRESLIINGDFVTATGGEVNFQLGGSLELTPGSVLENTGAGGQFVFNPGSGLKITNATLRARQDVILGGSQYLTGGLIESIADDVEFQDKHDTVINGTSIVADDNIIFDNSATAVIGAMFEAGDSLSMRYEIDITVTDTALVFHDDEIRGGVEDRFIGPQGEGSTLTLRGASTLSANSILDGIDLVLEGTSIATLTRDPFDDPQTQKRFEIVDPNGASTITFNSTGAELVIANPADDDARAFIINGLTGMSYLDDPMAWNVTNWDGTSPLASLMVIGNLTADVDGDSDVDGADFLAIQRTNPALIPDWESQFGNSAAVANASNVPEPSTALLTIGGLALAGAGRTRRAT